MAWWGRSRLARRTIWMRSLYLGSASWRKACSSRSTSAAGSRMRITDCLLWFGLIFLLMAHLQSVWVNLGRFSDFGEHTRKNLEAEVLLVMEPVGTPLDDPNLVVDA